MFRYLRDNCWPDKKTSDKGYLPSVFYGIEITVKPNATKTVVKSIITPDISS